MKIPFLFFHCQSPDLNKNYPAWVKRLWETVYHYPKLLTSGRFNCTIKRKSIQAEPLSYLQQPHSKNGLRKEARREWRKDLFGGLGISGLGPPQLARITSRTDETLPLASAAAKEHLHHRMKREVSNDTEIQQWNFFFFCIGIMYFHNTLVVKKKKKKNDIKLWI